MIELISLEIEKQKDALSRLDTEIGDGDHGFSMASGFNSVRSKLNEYASLSMDEMLKKVGFELIKTIGGAAGAVFGTLFTGQASYYKNYLSGTESLSLENLSNMLNEALIQIKRRGGAVQGDKTMVDALEPAVLSICAAHLEGKTLAEAFRIAAAAAKTGAEKTKGMVAKHGRSKNLGQRALGFIDPGAVSTTIMFEIMADYIQDQG